MFKSILAGVVTFVAISGVAVAADATWTKPTYDWSGLYVGGFIGSGTGHLTGLGAIANEGPSGLDAGLHAFYSYQTPGNWVLSPFVAIPLAQAKGTVLSGDPIKVSWAVVGGLKVGYAINRWQPYGFVAGVVGRGDGGIFGQHTHTGYSLGLGLDYALTDRWSVGARYAYVSISPETYAGSFDVGMHGNSIAATFSYKLQ